MKKTISIILTLVLSFSLIACGNQTETEIPTAGATPAAAEATPAAAEATPATGETTPAAEETPPATEETPEPAKNDAITAEYDAGTRTLTFRGQGPIKDYGEEVYNIGFFPEDEPEWSEYRNEAEHLIVEEGITAIGNNAFSGFSALVSAQLPQSIDRIGIGAFGNCMELQDLTMPHVRVVDDFAFSGTNISRGGELPLVIPEGCEHIGSYAYQSIGVYALESISVSLPSTLKTIGLQGLDSYSFYEYNVDANNPYFCSLDGVLFSKDMTQLIYYPNKKPLTEYTVPDGVVSLADGCFCNVQDLEVMYFPASVTDMDEAFGGQYSMLRYEVDENNPAYRSTDGVLFSKDGKKLIAFPLARTGAYTIPDGTEQISSSAMEYISISELTIPASFRIESIDRGTSRLFPEAYISSYTIEKIRFADGTTTIYDGELSGWMGGEYTPEDRSVYIPASVTEIKDHAFPARIAGLNPDDYYNFTKPAEIYYGGTQEQWEKITVGEDNDAVFSVPIHFAS